MCVMPYPFKKKENIVKKRVDKTNRELAKDMGCTPRQISKSRKRGWIWRDDKKVKYKAPLPVQL